MLNSGHDQPLANTCVAAVAVVSDCRQTRVKNYGLMLDRGLIFLCILHTVSFLYVLHTVTYIILRKKLMFPHLRIWGFNHVVRTEYKYILRGWNVLPCHNCKNKYYWIFVRAINYPVMKITEAFCLGNQPFSLFLKNSTQTHQMVRNNKQSQHWLNRPMG